MEKKEFLNEESYQRSNQKVKKIGKVLIIIGLILLGLGLIFLLCGFLGIGSQVTSGFETGQEGIQASKVFSGVGFFAIGAFMMTPGFFITIVGLVVRFLIGNRREITAYTTQQVMPVAQEGIEKMAPTIGKATGEIAKGIAAGIKEGLKDVEK